MVNMQSILIANGVAILLMVIVLISQRKTTRYGLLDEKIYYAMVTLTILQAVVESATFFIDGKVLPGYRNLAIILNSFLYINNIAFSFAWTVYADYKMFADTLRLKKIYPWVAMPALAVMMGSIINLFTPVFFTVSMENVYSRTGLYFITYVITYFYLAYGVILIYAYRKKVQRYLFLPAIIFMIPILIGSLLQYLFYGLSLVWIGVAIGMVSLYVNVQNEVSYIDELSGLFSRQYLGNYLTTQFQKGNGKLLLAGIMLDVDRFKSINDKFGHRTGDEAIADVGVILRSAVGDDGFAARYAGDEFVVIRKVKKETDIQELVEKIHRLTEEYNMKTKKCYQIHFSMGASVYRGKGDTIDDFLRRMDQEMYEEKKRKVNQKIIPERRIQ